MHSFNIAKLYPQILCESSFCATLVSQLNSSPILFKNIEMFKMC